MDEGVRPLVLLDVDGPLNPYAAKPTRRPVGYETFRMHPLGWPNRKGLRVWLNPRHGDMLGALADATRSDLAWCTTWMYQANALIGPVVGLPDLPVVPFEHGASSWKYDGVLTYAGDRPLLWFDDEFSVYPTERDRFLDQRGFTPTALYHVNPRVGLTFEDMVRARDWLSNEARA